MGYLSPNTSGSFSVSPAQSTTYSGSVSGTYGTGSCSTALTVTPPPAPATTITAGATSLYVNQSTTITATFAAGSGDQLTGDNIDEPLGTGLGASTNPDATKQITFTPTSPGTYTFYAMAQTQYYQSWTSYATVTVTVTANPYCSLTFDQNPSTQGVGTTLRWTSQNVTSFSINNGIGSVTPDQAGSAQVDPNTTTTYTGTVQYKVGSGSKTIYLTSGTTWSVPADWNSANNTIEVIAAGGSGGAGQESSGVAKGSGGGGGAYEEKYNVTLTPGGSITYAIGTGGAAVAESSNGSSNGAAGGDTYVCNSTSNCAAIAAGAACTNAGSDSAVVVCAQGGAAGNGSGGSSSSLNGGSGGATGSGIGDAGNSGGRGGNITSATSGKYGSGGGGAGGSTGAGTAGVDITTTSSIASNGGSGDSGSGGAGGAAGNSANGTGGGAGAEWASGYGSGGGGGGSQNIGTNTAGSGGSYGAGGGGGGSTTGGTVTSGSGSQGIIVITYSPLVTNITTCPATLSVSCTVSYSCSGETIVKTNADCSTTNVTTCVSPSFCSSGSSQCLEPAPQYNQSGNLTGHLQIIPAIVHPEGTTHIYWNLSNVQNSTCDVHGTNGDDWPDIPSAGANGELTSPITEQTTYTLMCTGDDGSKINETQTVNVAPLFEED